jgi:hypothetical protein
MPRTSQQLGVSSRLTVHLELCTAGCPFHLLPSLTTLISRLERRAIDLIDGAFDFVSSSQNSKVFSENNYSAGQIKIYLEALLFIFLNILSVKQW